MRKLLTEHDHSGCILKKKKNDLVCLVFIFEIFFCSSGFFGETTVMDLDLNKDGTILYSAAGNNVKMVDLKT